MRKLTYLLPVAALLSVAACEPQKFDNHGNLVDAGTAQNATEDTHTGDGNRRFDNKVYHDHNEDYMHDGSAVTQTTTNYSANGDTSRTTTVTTYYNHAGYYDQSGHQVVAANAPHVPKSMWPAKGSCRIWFPATIASDQPAPESCDGIQNRVPDGAYVIYGG